MRNYFIFLPDSGGVVDSRELSIHIEHMPDIQRAPERVEKIVIPGRSGTLTKTQGENVYDSYIKSFDIVAMDEEKIQSIQRLLRGSGKIIFSNEPQFRYTVSITDGWSFNRFFRQWRRATISMETFPFKEKSEEKVWRGVFVESGIAGQEGARGTRTELNIETDIPCPFFAEIDGGGESQGILSIYLNGIQRIQGVVIGEKIFLDNEKILLYNECGENQLKMQFSKTGQFPMYLIPGKNILETRWYGTSITVKCRGWFL